MGTAEKRQKKEVRNYTEGCIPKQLILFALPFMASNAMQVLYSLVDMMVVGKYVGSYGLSAVSTASQIFTFATMLCMGLSTGGQVYIAQLVGADKKDVISKTVGTMFSVLIMMGIALSAVILIFGNQLLHLLNTPPESYEMASGYLVVCGIGLIFSFGYNMVSAVFRGLGDSRHPFLFIMLASVVNLVLDLVFTGALQWGVPGAALATIIGQALSFLCALFYLYRNRARYDLEFRREDFHIQKEILVPLTELAIPFAISSCAINISMMFVNRMINGLGVYASATFGVGCKLDDIINKVSQGIMLALSPMVGQNLAAKKPERVKKLVYWAWGYSAVFYLLFTIVYLIFNRQMFGLFTDDANVIELAPVFVYAIVWSFPSMALMRGSNGFVQGIGYAKLSMVLGILDGFVLRIVFSYLFGVVFETGLFGFVLGYGMASYGSTIPSTIYFLSGRWKKRKSLVE